MKRGKIGRKLVEHVGLVGVKTCGFIDKSGVCLVAYVVGLRFVDGNFCWRNRG